jgi:hypothetical protein
MERARLQYPGDDGSGGGAIIKKTPERRVRMEGVEGRAMPEKCLKHCFGMILQGEIHPEIESTLHVPRRSQKI